MGQGACPRTEDAEEVEDLLTYCQNQLQILVQTLEVGVVKGQVVPPPSSVGLWLVPLDSLQTGGAVGIVTLATLACTTGATAWVTGGAGTNGAAMGGGGKEYGGGGTPIRIGAIRGGGGKFNCGGYWIGFRV